MSYNGLSQQQEKELHAQSLQRMAKYNILPAIDFTNSIRENDRWRSTSILPVKSDAEMIHDYKNQGRSHEELNSWMKPHVRKKYTNKLNLSISRDSLMKELDLNLKYKTNLGNATFIKFKSNRGKYLPNL